MIDLCEERLTTAVTAQRRPRTPNRRSDLRVVLNPAYRPARPPCSTSTVGGMRLGSSASGPLYAS